MFYCEPCRVKNDWPTALSYSKGKCECCGNATGCYDRPSSSLPPVAAAPKPEKTDRELVADAKMIAGELSRVLQALAGRGIEADVLTYQGGRIEVTGFERVTREKL